MPDRSPTGARELKVLVAPDSFKGTFDAPQVAHAIGRGLDRAGVNFDTCPVADGGEGTLDVVTSALGGAIGRAAVRDPLGRPTEARFGVVSQIAIVEMAAATGLSLLAHSELDPWKATTYGTGQLICAAVHAGARRVLVTVGALRQSTVAGALRAIEDGGGLRGGSIPRAVTGRSSARSSSAPGGSGCRLTRSLDAASSPAREREGSVCLA